MKIAIFGQYYQNDTRPIIRDIFLFFNNNNVELVIEEKFLKILYAEEILKKEYKTFNDYKCLDSISYRDLKLKKDWVLHPDYWIHFLNWIRWTHQKAEVTSVR